MQAIIDPHLTDWFPIQAAAKPSIHEGRIVMTTFHANVLDCFGWTLSGAVYYVTKPKH